MPSDKPSVLERLRSSDATGAMDVGASGVATALLDEDLIDDAALALADALDEIAELRERAQHLQDLLNVASMDKQIVQRELEEARVKSEKQAVAIERFTRPFMDEEEPPAVRKAQEGK